MMADNQFQQMPQQPMPPVQPPVEQKASAGLAILSFLIPLVGLILFLTKKKDRPKTAKACGVAALVSVALGIIFSVVIGIAGGGVVSSAIKDSENIASYEENIQENNDTENVQANNSTHDENGTVIGDYECQVIDATLTKDYAGKDAILVTYSFTNNSDSAISFDIALEDNLYQDGIGLETAILEDDTDILDVDIKPGVTKEVKKAYVLNNTTSDVEVEISEWISFSDDKIVTTINLNE